MRSEIKREEKHKYNEDLKRAVDLYLIATSFTLHFNEKLKLGKKRLFDVLRDIQATVELFDGKEYSPKDYEQMLKDDGINIKILLD